MRKVYRNQSDAPGESGDDDIQSHSQSSQIKGKAPLDFTTTDFDSFEVAKAFAGCKLGFIGGHSVRNVGLRPHLNMEAQF